MLQLNSSKFRLAIFLGLASIFALGCYLVLSPDNHFMRLFRGEISDIDAQVVIGPYPTESDMRKLQSAKIETIVSLLDPNLPYEKILLDEEKELAEKYHFKLLNFPMASVLGYKLGDYYKANAEAAANAVMASKGKTYLHCYLGVHRAQVVKELIKNNHLAVGSYLLRKGERGNQKMIEDQAEQFFSEGKYEEAISTLNQLPSLNHPATVLTAWSNYRLQHIPEARKFFTQALAQKPDSIDASTGLAYCDLNENKLDAAWQRFSEILKQDANNPAALSGAGAALYRQSKFAEAEKLLRRAVELNPQDEEAQQTLNRIKEIRASR